MSLAVQGGIVACYSHEAFGGHRKSNKAESQSFPAGEPPLLARCTVLYFVFDKVVCGKNKLTLKKEFKVLQDSLFPCSLALCLLAGYSSSVV